MATILDAHPKISISYEIYEELLTLESGAVLSTASFLEYLEPQNLSDDKSLIRTIPEKNLRTFLYRASRGGLSVADVRTELESFQGANKLLANLDDRIDFIDSLRKRKMSLQGKTMWGGKTKCDLSLLHSKHPDAVFLIVLRDVRDVVASQLSKGNFDRTSIEIAEMWARHISDFRNFVRERKPRSMEVVYENLVAEPEKHIRELCGKLNVDFTPDLLRFHEEDLTLFRNPHGHLSAEQLKAGLSNASLGRWRKILTSEQAKEVEQIAERVKNIV